MVTRPDLAQDCYTMAYFVLPRYVFDDPERLISELTENGLRAGMLYMMACGMNGREPQMDLLRSFPVHAGDLGGDTRYCVVEFPTPPHVNLSDMTMEEVMASADAVVLAPYFAAVVTRPQSPPRYFVLGQSPDGFTTLRRVTQNSNANLGPGCEPELIAFVELLREQCS